MPYKHDASLKAKLAELEAATKVVKQEARALASSRSPLAARVRRLKTSLDRALKRRSKLRTWSNFSDQACECIHGQDWRDLQARITSLDAELISTQTTLAIFDLEHTQ
jgi:uncharacterized coiled-coil DUF342 family protein